MVRLVQGGAAEFSALAYHERHPATVSFLAQQFDNLTTRLTDAGQKFIAGARQLYDQFNSSEALARARAIARSVETAFQRDEIRSLWDIACLQNASPINQRFMMANPVWRAEYHAQRCDGFSGSYVDVYPSDIKHTHLDYQMVMHGIVREVEPEKEGEEPGFKATFYFDELPEGERPLDFEEQVDILSTWDVMNSLFKLGVDDPTSPVGGKL